MSERGGRPALPPRQSRLCSGASRQLASRQFAETFSLPPTNHFANGARHSRTLDHGAIQSRPLPSAPKGLGIFRALRVQRVVVEERAFRKAADGVYRSFSFRRLSIVAPETTKVNPQGCPVLRFLGPVESFPGNDR